MILNSSRSQMDATQQARLLAAVADPSRLRIIQCLRSGPQTVGKIAEAVQLAVVNASHHLGVLRQAGIVQDHKRGRFVEYQLHPDVFQPATKSGESEMLKLGGLRLELPK
jgi:DNA-binding transcriptional ArsR family regulator